MEPIMANTLIDKLAPDALGRWLQSGRKAKKLTQQQAADYLDVARTTIVAIEKGQRRIRELELVRLAELYGLSLNHLLRPRVDMRLAVELRAAFHSTSVVEEEVEPFIDELQVLCEDFLELERMAGASTERRYPEPYDVSSVAPERAAEDYAVLERNRLGLGDGPLLNLRAVLENDVGLRVFYLDLPRKVAAMFGYTDELGGCMAVNRNHPAEKRRLSIAHEYGHFISRRDRAEVNILSRYQRVPESERFADTFSYAFLMPSTGLSRRFAELRRARGGKTTVADLCQLAHLYFVSFEALTRRLEHLRLIPGGTHERLQDGKFEVRKAQQMLGLAPQPVNDHVVPSRYQILAVEAFQRGDVSEGQLMRFLRTDRSTARDLVARLVGPLRVDDGGTVGSSQLNLGLQV
jgi:Zn-dependent peptidase ImmA (M78 family)/DNA-binding XRE family transcriptional regulator